jgi:hypothetical protein
LLIRRTHGSWSAPTVTSYQDEAELRDMLAGEPRLLPGVGERAAAAVEFPVSGVGAVDVVAVDQEGAITLVECKLRSNPEIRRQVVGQVLAYAAGLWRADLTSFENAWKSRDSASRSLAHAVLGEEHSDEEADALRDACASALRDGRFSLVLAVDEITDELRQIVEYLNAHTLSEVAVLALELGYAREGDLEIAVPRVFGAELAGARQRPRARWTEEELLAALARAGDVAEQAGRRILDHFRGRAGFYFGQGRYPSVTLYFEQPARFQPLSIWADADPSISPNFEWTAALGHESRRAFVDAIAAIPEANIDPDKIAAAAFAKRPSLKIRGVLDREGNLERLIHAVDALAGVSDPDQ